VDADGPGLLGDPGDRLLDVAGGDHHQVVELVDDDDDVRQPLVLGVGRAVRVAGQLTAVERLVVATDVAEADLRQQVVAPLHLLDRPGQRVGGLLGVGDGLGQQVG
jgi:hypothetical protein